MRVLLALAALLVLAVAVPAGAVHFYRNGGGGCAPAEGALGDSGPGIMGANVWMLHNAFLDLRTGGPVTVIQAGQSVTWSWASAHCHSAKSGTPVSADSTFYSGFLYPTPTPEVGPVLLTGFFDYPLLDATPALSYTKTFDTPGTFTYYCEHHAAIGMVGVVVVT